jgi:hypothetical protein
METVVLKHPHSGFFSTCSCRLMLIIHYFNSNKKLPRVVDATASLNWYKINNDTDSDITFDYFKHYDDYPIIEYAKPIDYDQNHQFKNYIELDYSGIQPFIVKYFTPTNEIEQIITNIEKKYNIEHENTCVLFYRGNDKNRETSICGYDEYILYANKILEKNPNIQFLIQSDETGFIEKMLETYPTNSFYFKDEIRHMHKNNSTVDDNKYKIDVFSKNYLAITKLMSKSKFIVCGTGNCSIWIMIYRGSNKNTLQNFNGEWHVNLETPF